MCLVLTVHVFFAVRLADVNMFDNLPEQDFDNDMGWQGSHDLEGAPQTSFLAGEHVALHS